MPAIAQTRRRSVLPCSDQISEIKEAISRDLRGRLKEHHVSVSELARNARTSRAAVRRILDGGNKALTLQSLVRAANALGYRVRFSLEPSIDRIDQTEPPAGAQVLMERLGKALDRIPPAR